MISLGSLHVRCTLMWALSTCGEPNEFDLTPVGLVLNRHMFENVHPDLGYWNNREIMSVKLHTRATLHEWC